MKRPRWRLTVPRGREGNGRSSGKPALRAPSPAFLGGHRARAGDAARDRRPASQRRTLGRRASSAPCLTARGRASRADGGARWRYQKRPIPRSMARSVAGGAGGGDDGRTDIGSRPSQPRFRRLFLPPSAATGRVDKEPELGFSCFFNGRGRWTRRRQSVPITT